MDALLVTQQRITDFDILVSEFDDIVKQCDITPQIPLPSPLLTPKVPTEEKETKQDSTEVGLSPVVPCVLRGIQKTPYRLLRSAKKKLANLEELESKLKFVLTEFKHL